jgi:signal transduction histidine kinase
MSLIKMISTIRFKLTLLYSFILLVLASLVVLGLNIALSAWMSSDPPTPPSSGMGMITQFPRGTMLWLDLSDKERESIREIRKNDLETFQALSIVSLLPISVVSFILGYFIAGKFLKPIDELADTLQHMQSEHLGKTLPKSSDDEVGRLIDSFNNMSITLRSSFDKQQQLVADASHEIKTPLAIIQTSLDTTLDDKGANNKELREAMSDALVGVKRLRKLADDLLAITAPFELTGTLSITEVVERQIDLLTKYLIRME